MALRGSRSWLQKSHTMQKSHIMVSKQHKKPKVHSAPMYQIMDLGSNWSWLQKPHIMVSKRQQKPKVCSAPMYQNVIYFMDTPILHLSGEIPLEKQDFS